VQPAARPLDDGVLPGDAPLAGPDAKADPEAPEISPAPPSAPPATEPAPDTRVAGAAAPGDAELDILRSDPELASMFIAEALDHLGTIEATILQLESSPGDARLLDDVFRPFHTIKGNAGALGLGSIQELSHAVETLLDLARAGALAIGPDETDAILKAVDLLTSLVSDLTRRLAGEPARPLEAERQALLARVETLARRERAAAPPADSRPAPAASGVEPDFGPGAQAAWAPDADRQAIPEAEPIGPAGAPGEPAATDGPPAARRVEPAVAAVKVDTRKLDNLVDMVGELVIVQSMVSADPAVLALSEDRLSRNLAQLRRITSDLQRTAMALRMVPIRPTFQKMARLVRDLSRKAGKPVELVLSGEDTELDRKVVEDIADPLMHMIRNSLDHGIEPPERRAALGKPRTGRLSLSACHQGGSIVIAVSDDGAGLNAEKILARAVAQGLVPPGETPEPADIYPLIFRPGFSTAEQVTEISGRGVGMDVVRRNIEALRGRIEIQTEPGRGTTFSIKLPLTLAIVEGLLLRVGQERFVLPTFSVRESLRPAAGQVHTVHGRARMIRVRDTLVPLVSLAELFGLDGAVADPCQATVVVIEDDDRRVALQVDELLGKQEVVIKSLGGAFAHVRGVAGGAILGDGRVGLILDAGGLIALKDARASAAA
jgi:two-component system chemotaxis sensor kinase CheA